MNAAAGALTYPRPHTIERCLDLLFPPTCVACRRPGRWICERCWPMLPWAWTRRCGTCGEFSATNPCLRCAHSQSAVRTVVAVADFDGAAREAVHALKYEGRHAISSTMGRLMAAALQDGVPDLVTPVPLHRARRRERGYDQAALLARTLAAELGVPCDAGALARTRRTQQQVTLGPEQRRSNVAGAFIAQRVLNGQTVLLVDDVFTTGATMRAAARAVLDAGGGEVTGMVFAYATVGRDRR